MEIAEIKHDNFVTIRPVGELDANSSIFVDEKMNQLLEEKLYNIHVDCSGISYISSAGLGVFISYLDEIVSQGGRLIFSDMTSNVFDVFDLLGLNQIMEIVKTSAEAQTQFEYEGQNPS